VSGLPPVEQAFLPEPVCPVCGGALSPSGITLTCAGCGRQFGLTAGIPDLRLAPDEADLFQARALEERFERLDFAGLVREGGRLQTGSMSQNPILRERFIAHSLGSVGTAAAYLAALENERGHRLHQHDRLLELGCGTGALAAAAATRGAQVVATDISMRALVLAKKRLTDMGLGRVRLICCDGEEPVFSPNSFDVIAASDVIEHAARPQAFLTACRELLAPEGMLFLATPNRFSLSLEPHVRLWGVGFLPRALAGRYVHAFRKVSYDRVSPFSAPQLRRLLVAQGLEPKIVAPEIPLATQALYRGFELRLVGVYNRLRRFPLIHPMLLAVGPFFHVFARKRPSGVDP
jgi:2-polyprenyl-3-methyl-5-hydroxy-6-metoxy-1,4-benzoquinol methylase